MTLPNKKFDPAQKFPGNNPPLYCYPFNTLVFRLNPCRIPDQENKHVVLFNLRTEFVIG